MQSVKMVLQTFMHMCVVDFLARFTVVNDNNTFAFISVKNHSRIFFSFSSPEPKTRQVSL